MHEQTHVVGEIAQRANFVDGVERSHFGRLGDREYRRLHVVFATEEMFDRGQPERCHLAIDCVDFEQLRADDSLGGARLVVGDVRVATTHDRFGRTQETAEGKHVGARAAIGELGDDVAVEEALERLLSAASPRIIAVGECVAFVCCAQCLQNLGSRTRSVVTRKPPLRRRKDDGHDSVCASIHHIDADSSYLFVMTKRSAASPVGKCLWCRQPLPPGATSGRPRKFCSQSCRQWDWVARQRAEELHLSETELVVQRAELDRLRDQIFVLRCAVEDVEGDLDPKGDPTTRDFKAALRWILDAARPLVSADNDSYVKFGKPKK